MNIYLFEYIKKAETLITYINDLDISEEEIYDLIEIAKSDIHHEVMTFIVSQIPQEEAIKLIEEIDENIINKVINESLKKQIELIITNKELLLLEKIKESL